MKVQDAATRKVVIPGKALQSLIERQVSGTVTIFDPLDESVYWHIYLGRGKIHFATSGIGRHERLVYLLLQLFPGTGFPLSKTVRKDYDYVCKIWRMGKFSLKQVRQVLFYMTQEALTQILALPRATVKFDKALGLDPLLLSLSLRQMIRPLQPQIRNWVQIRTAINSPFQRLRLDDAEQLINQSVLDLDDYKVVENMIEVLQENYTLYELCVRARKTTEEMGLLLQPLVQLGCIKVFPYEAIADEPKPLVACIDDSKATQRVVKMTLEAGGLQVIGVTESAQALSIFARQRPEVILMDINMPEIDGYELCRMFNQSDVLKDIPVIMLTGRDGLLDRIRARMVGASDYIAKPFHPQELIQLVKSYLGEKLPDSKFS